MGSSGMWMSVAASGLSTVLYLSICTLFLVISYVYVRPSRPDVWPLVAGWAGASLLLSALGFTGSRFVSVFVGNAHGPDTMLGSMALMTVVFSILRTGVDCVLAYAIVLLAKGRKPSPGG